MGHTVTKKMLIEALAHRTGKTKDEVGLMLHAILDQMVAELVEGNRIEFRDFGVFEVRQRAARKGKNPKTSQELDVPPRRSVKFKAGAEVKKKLDAAITPAGNGSNPAELNTKIHGKADLDGLIEPKVNGKLAAPQPEVRINAKPPAQAPKVDPKHKP